MTEGTRTRLIAVMVIMMAASAFTAGFFANDYVELLRDGPTAGGDDRAAFNVFWEAWGWVEQSYIGQLPTPHRLAYGAIRGALAELNDPYTLFIEPVDREKEKESLRGNFSGIGANLQRDEAGNLILSPILGNPAALAGIVEGDILLKVDQVEITAEMTVEAIAELIRGEKGTSVVLTVLHPGTAAPVEVVVERADILIPSVDFRLLEQDPTIGYVQLTRFSGESAGEVRGAVESLLTQGADRLILDLRHNGGGLLDAAVEVSDLFLSDGPILYQQSRGSQETTYMADAELMAEGVPLVLLVDGASASSSEIVAGALGDRERATLIGSRTFGKGSVQLVYDLSDGSSIHVTSARWLTPDRHQIDQQGLEPDIAIENTQEAIDNGQDLVLERAIEFLQIGS